MYRVSVSVFELLAEGAWKRGIEFLPQIARVSAHNRPLIEWMGVFFCRGSCVGQHALSGPILMPVRIHAVT